MKIKIEGELPDLNKYINAERTNKYKAAGIKADATDQVAWQVLTAKVITKPAHYHFHWTVKNKRKDPDNIAWACKFVFDGLQKAGKLKNDNMEMILSIHHTFSIGKPSLVVTVATNPILV